MALRLDYAEVTGAGLERLAGLTQLVDLSLDSTLITDRSTLQLRRWAKLKSLNLYHTMVTQKGYAELKSALRVLSGRGFEPPQSTPELIHMPILFALLLLYSLDEGKPVKDAAGETVELDLTGTWVSDADMAKVAQLRHLRKLDLSQTRKPTAVWSI